VLNLVARTDPLRRIDVKERMPRLIGNLLEVGGVRGVVTADSTTIKISGSHTRGRNGV